ncbi:MAG: hypothetical protein KJ804_17335 [Proteobacteria bacterium]|nr:hypothetical protein [Pseudomonadota bacterium]MBU1060070.1 hypothetical protein [Pseudomonadota bacterium]
MAFVHPSFLLAITVRQRDQNHFTKTHLCDEQKPKGYINVPFKPDPKKPTPPPIFFLCIKLKSYPAAPHKRNSYGIPCATHCLLAARTGSEIKKSDEIFLTTIYERRKDEIKTDRNLSWLRLNG